MLVAMNEDGAYSYPSQLDDDERTETILELRRECSKDVWLCPHCFALSKGQNKHPVSLVNPKAKVIHFRHKIGDRTQECQSYRGESDKHLSAKMAIMGHLAKDAQTALIESRRYGENQEFRTPDVAIVSKTGIHSAHEIQVSRITVDKLSERTKALLNLGFKQVHWYLYGGNCKDENVNYLIKMRGCYPYRLQFDQDGLPLWSPIAAPIVAEPRIPAPTKHDVISRTDKDGKRWTYHKPSDTIALYFGKEGQRHSIRLPGDRVQNVVPSDILDPAHPASGGLARWPQLQN